MLQRTLIISAVVIGYFMFRARCAVDNHRIKKQYTYYDPTYYGKPGFVDGMYSKDAEYPEVIIIEEVPLVQSYHYDDVNQKHHEHQKHHHHHHHHHHHNDNEECDSNESDEYSDGDESYESYEDNNSSEEENTISNGQNYNPLKPDKVPQIPSIDQKPPTQNTNRPIPSNSVTKQPVSTLPDDKNIVLTPKPSTEQTSTKTATVESVTDDPTFGIDIRFNNEKPSTRRRRQLLSGLANAVGGAVNDFVGVGAHLLGVRNNPHRPFSQQPQLPYMPIPNYQHGRPQYNPNYYPSYNYNEHYDSDKKHKHKDDDDCSDDEDDDHHHHDHDKKKHKNKHKHEHHDHDHGHNDHDHHDRDHHDDDHEHRHQGQEYYNQGHHNQGYPNQGYHGQGQQHQQTSHDYYGQGHQGGSYGHQDRYPNQHGTQNRPNGEFNPNVMHPVMDDTKFPHQNQQQFHGQGSTTVDQINTSTQSHVPGFVDSFDFSSLKPFPHDNGPLQMTGISPSTLPGNNVYVKPAPNPGFADSIDFSSLKPFPVDYGPLMTHGVSAGTSSHHTTSTSGNTNGFLDTLNLQNPNTFNTDKKPSGGSGGGSATGGNTDFLNLQNPTTFDNVKPHQDTLNLQNPNTFGTHSDGDSFNLQNPNTFNVNNNNSGKNPSQDPYNYDALLAILAANKNDTSTHGTLPAIVTTGKHATSTTDDPFDGAGADQGLDVRGDEGIIVRQ